MRKSVSPLIVAPQAVLRRISILIFISFAVLSFSGPLHAAEGRKASSQAKKTTVSKSASSKSKTTKLAASQMRARYAPTSKKVVLSKKSTKKIAVVSSDTPAKIQIKPSENLIVPVSGLPQLEVVELKQSLNGNLSLEGLPPFKSRFLDRVASKTANNDFVFFTVDPDLQEFANKLSLESKAPHVAIVVMNPNDGRILAIAEKSREIAHPTLHAHFPAASLFKVVTTAAALERGAVNADSEIRFRGGTYTLNQWNYLPNQKLDRRSMTVTEALGKSCNPVFARIALNYLDPGTVRSYAQMFGFNTPLGFEVPLENSFAYIPNDEFEFGRTAAGFGEVMISPVHAAALMSGLANGGVLPRPTLVDQIVSARGEVLYTAQPAGIRRIVQASTAHKLLQMMESTTTIGTSRKEFMYKNQPVLRDVTVAGKTGTLAGENPEGINNWFIGAAPIENPQIALAVVIVSPGKITSRASHIGKRLMEYYFQRP